MPNQPNKYQWLFGSSACAHTSQRTVLVLHQRKLPRTQFQSVEQRKSHRLFQKDGKRILESLLRSPVAHRKERIGRCLTKNAQQIRENHRQADQLADRPADDATSKSATQTLTGYTTTHLSVPPRDVTSFPGFDQTVNSRRNTLWSPLLAGWGSKAAPSHRTLRQRQGVMWRARVTPLRTTNSNSAGVRVTSSPIREGRRRKNDES